MAISKVNEIMAKCRLLGENPVACNDWGIVVLTPSGKYKLINAILGKEVGKLYKNYAVLNNFIILENDINKQSCFVKTSLSDKMKQFRNSATVYYKDPYDDIIIIDGYNNYKFMMLNKNGKSKYTTRESLYFSCYVKKLGENRYSLMYQNIMMGLLSDEEDDPRDRVLMTFDLDFNRLV